MTAMTFLILMFVLAVIAWGILFAYAIHGSGDDLP